MTSIQNGGYFWLKKNYRVYLCCLEFLSEINYLSFCLGRKRFREDHSSRRNRLLDVANQDGDSQGGAVDLRCLGVYRNFSHVGMIRRIF